MKDDLNEKQVFTGLLKESSSTQETILEVFWMNMEFLVCITLDEQNQVYIETFAFGDEIQPICDKIPLCDLGSFESVECKTDPKRQLISFFMFNTVSPSLFLDP
jgi:hypothetical protein